MTTKTLTARLGEDEVGQTNVSIVPGQTLKLEVSNFDGQCLYIALDGQQVVKTNIAPESIRPSNDEAQISLGAQSGNVEISRLQIKRDIHYLPWNRESRPIQNPEKDSSFPSQYRLEDDEYFVLGDNVWLSIDSRNWTRPGIKQSSILGRVQTSE